MFGVHACSLPEDALLDRCLRAGAYVDCYVTNVPNIVSQAEYVEAFYTTVVFRLERLLLGWFASRPSSDGDAHELAGGRRTSFAAWQVEGRSNDQLLLADFTGRTRSWLMTEPAPAASPNPGTRLYFGSAVIPVAGVRSAEPTLGLAFGSLLGFHKVYSRVLLLAARARVARSHR